MQMRCYMARSYAVDKHAVIWPCCVVVVVHYGPGPVKLIQASCFRNQQRLSERSVIVRCHSAS